LRGWFPQHIRVGIRHEFILPWNVINTFGYFWHRSLPKNVLGLFITQEALVFKHPLFIWRLSQIPPHLPLPVFDREKITKGRRNVSPF